MTIKIDFEFKKGDYVELAGMSEEQVESLEYQMLSQSGKIELYNENHWSEAEGLVWDTDGDVYYACKPYALQTLTTNLLTIEDIFPTTEQEFDTDIENCKTSLEELGCESVTVKVENKGEQVYEGVVKDSSGMMHDVQFNELAFELQDVTTWYCFKEVAEVLGEENAEYELGKVLRQINDGDIYDNAFGRDLRLSQDNLKRAFAWSKTLQRALFWRDISLGFKPEEYDSTPDTPPAPEVDKKATPALKELMKLSKGDVKGTVEGVSQTLGELVEAIQANIPPHVGIHFQPDGEVLLECDNAYVVVSELDSEGVDKAIEFVAHYGHLVIGKNVEG